MWRVMTVLMTSLAMNVTPAIADTLDSTITSPHRAESAARDVYRNPKATLEFLM